MSTAWSVEAAQDYYHWLGFVITLSETGQTSMLEALPFREECF